jgi:hypothetical protein
MVVVFGFGSGGPLMVILAFGTFPSSRDYAAEIGGCGVNPNSTASYSVFIE